MVGRRRFLILATVSTVGLAGCASQEAQFLVTDIQRIHQPGHDVFDYPEDILYRISIENTGPSRKEGRLELTLVYEPDSGQGETWERSEQISLSRGTSVQREFVFENVYEEGNDIEAYDLEATIVES